jgi:hypothetical protein
MVFWSLGKPLSLNLSQLGTNVWNSIIFIFGHLIKGLIIIGIKKSIVELSANVAWNAELTYSYILSTFKHVIKFVKAGRIRNLTQLDIIIAEIIEIDSSIRARAVRLMVSATMSSISAAVRLRSLTYTRALSIWTFLRHRLPFIINKRNQAHDNAPLEHIVAEIRTASVRIPAEQVLNGSTNRLTNNRKRIDFSDTLKEDQDTIEGELLQT